MKFDEELREAEFREAVAPVAILRILLGVRPQLRPAVLECVTCLVKADAARPGIVEQFARSHPAIKNGGDA
jgi:hypothetical protein